MHGDRRGDELHAIYRAERDQCAVSLFHGSGRHGASWMGHAHGIYLRRRLPAPHVPGGDGQSVHARYRIRDLSSDAHERADDVSSVGLGIWTGRAYRANGSDRINRRGFDRGGAYRTHRSDWASLNSSRSNRSDWASLNRCWSHGADWTDWNGGRRFDGCRPDRTDRTDRPDLRPAVRTSHLGQRSLAGARDG